MVLLRSTTLSTAHKVFNRFRQAVQDYNFPQVGQVTVSLGFVCTSKGAPVEILGQADQALYYAKEHGRNQVCFYDDLVAGGHLVAKVANDDVELF
ncbi:putative diguanylate cyclase YcdT [compost metagenome]